MKITITATEHLTEIDGVPVRAWDGVTEAGIACVVFIHRIAVRGDADCTEFERELGEKMPTGKTIPLRMIL